MDGKWTLKTSPNRPHNHSNIERKLDIFLYAAVRNPAARRMRPVPGPGSYRQLGTRSRRRIWERKRNSPTGSGFWSSSR